MTGSKARHFPWIFLLAGIGAGGCASTQESSFDPPSSPTQLSGGYQVAIAAHASSFLTAYSSTTQPDGFSGTCGQYPWACSSQGGAISSTEALRIATRVNRQVNSRIRSATDRQLYGVEDRWALPVKGAGDCEDYALLKKKLLLEAGLPGGMLLLATALNRRSEPHAVLVLRLPTGDMILDNETSVVKPWQRTGHTYLKIQVAEHPSQWSSVLLGPLASRT